MVMVGKVNGTCEISIGKEFVVGMVGLMADCKEECAIGLGFVVVLSSFVVCVDNFLDFLGCLLVRKSTKSMNFSI